MQTTISVIGRGRLGTALARALRAGEPLGRGSDGAGADIVLLCVPDAEIAAAAAHVAPGRLVGHCSGATTLAPLAPHEAFSLHPLMTVPEEGAVFSGAFAAVAGSTPRALAAARDLARRLDMTAVEIHDADRAAYHAAASIASNYLVALETFAERLIETAVTEDGHASSTPVAREMLVPLVRAAFENWAATGERALTGPVVRGDEETVARQRAAVAERLPEQLALFDALTAATRDIARARRVPA